MEYFALLTAVTIVIAVLAWVLYRRRRDLGSLVGLAALYYWSLYGAWSIIIDKSGGASGQHYYYLERKMFPVALDGWYMLALALYAGFIILLEVTMLTALSRRRARPIPRMVLRHESILVLGFAAGIGSYFLIREKLSMAWALNTSAYWYTRAQTDEWFTLHQVLNRVAMIPPAIGLATLVAGKRSRFFINVVRPYTWPAYIVLMAGMAAFTFVLGNKNEVFTSLLAGVLAYAGSLRHPPWGKIVVVLAVGMTFLAAIDFFRATPISGIRQAVIDRASDSPDAASFMESSNEAFAAHFSMYGVLSGRVEPRFGYSLYSLLCSVIPRVIWKDRPRDIYLYYSESVGTIQNQGYSLHHATGWYLNFGYAGVAIGGILLGLLWAGCLNAHQRIQPKSGILFRLFATIAPWTLAAGIPALVRAGPEAYKGLVLESFLIPVATLVFACRSRKARKKRLVWHRQGGWMLAGKTS